MQTASRALGRLASHWPKALTRLARPFAASDDAIIVAMPQLSPTMTSGSIHKWLKQPGDQIKIYDIIAEIDTDTLTEEQSKVGKFEGTVTMLLESQEDVFLVKQLVADGKDVKVGSPIAVVCEFEEELEDLKGYEVPVKDVYGKGGDAVRMLTWQSYLKSDRGDDSSGCS